MPDSACRSRTPHLCTPRHPALRKGATALALAAMLTPVTTLVGAQEAATGTVASGEPAPAFGAAAPLVIGETLELSSRLLGETRRIHFYRPATAAAETPLPVLVLLDGGPAEDLLHIAGLLQVGAANGSLRPMLLVGVENTERRRDLTGPTQVASDREIAPRVGGSATFRRFLSEELLPAVEARHATTGERALIGESLAGLFVLETLLTEPALFSTYIAVDPSLWWNGGALVAGAGETLAAFGDHPRRLHLAVSDDGDRDERIEELAAVLERSAPAALTWTYRRHPQETHATVFHPAAQRALRELFRLH